jgi:hypothetical protein
MRNYFFFIFFFAALFFGAIGFVAFDAVGTDGFYRVFDSRHVSICGGRRQKPGRERQVAGDLIELRFGSPDFARRSRYPPEIPFFESAGNFTRQFRDIIRPPFDLPEGPDPTACLEGDHDQFHVSIVPSHDFFPGLDARILDFEYLRHVFGEKSAASDQAGGGQPQPKIPPYPNVPHIP